MLIWSFGPLSHSKPKQRATLKGLGRHRRPGLRLRAGLRELAAEGGEL